MLTTDELYSLLLEQLGPQGWWPAESELEMMIGAILVQNTNWNNVEKSLLNINRATNFQPEQLLKLTVGEFEALIRPSGFHKSKAKAVMTLIQWMHYDDFDYQAISRHHGKELRNELLKLHGIGPETADVLLVYLFDRIEFIPDSYTRRLYKRLGYPNTDNYNLFKKEVTLPDDFTNSDAKEFHALLDEFGKRYLSRSGIIPDYMQSYII